MGPCSRANAPLVIIGQGVLVPVGVSRAEGLPSGIELHLEDGFRVLGEGYHVVREVS